MSTVEDLQAQIDALGVAIHMGWQIRESTLHDLDSNPPVIEGYEVSVKYWGGYHRFHVSSLQVAIRNIERYGPYASRA